jgi:hypothetical protein
MAVPPKKPVETVSEQAAERKQARLCKKRHWEIDCFGAMTRPERVCLVVEPFIDD